MPRVRFSERPPTEVLTHPSSPPPPWEPRFEVLSSSTPSRRPLDPPPPCFSTPSPLRIRSHDFPPFLIPAASDDLADGFRLLYPRNTLDPHGICRADWLRFLEDLGIAARLSREGRSAVGSRIPLNPLISHRVFPSRAIGAVYDSRFSRNQVQQIHALVDMWNQCAFERRKIRVSLQMRPIETSPRKRYALVVESL